MGHIKTGLTLDVPQGLEFDFCFKQLDTRLNMIQVSPISEVGYLFQMFYILSKEICNVFVQK